MSPARPTIALWLAALALVSCGSRAVQLGPPCDGHSDCRADEVCVDGFCMADKIPCGAQAACPSGLSCCGGQCRVEQCCSVDFECPNGFCDGGVCSSEPRPTCSTDKPCDSGRCLLTLEPPRCVECLVAEDCADATHQCSGQHQCVPDFLAGCTPAECAASGLICAPEHGGCRPCLSQNECGDKICKDGTCQSCQHDPECGLGRTCESGQCVADPGTPCVSNADCGERVCVESGGGKQCTNCVLDVECGPDRDCNTTTGRCASDSPECTNDNHCAPPQTVCVAGACADGCGATGCASGYQCNPSTGRCVVLSEGDLDLGTACTDHDQCTSGVCWAVSDGDATSRYCSRACALQGDCPAGFSCISLGHGSLCMEHHRLPAGSHEGEPGAACDGDFSDTSCRSQWCDSSTNACYETCGKPNHCGGNECITRGTDQISVSFAQVCGAAVGSKPAGDTCSLDDECESGFCMQTPDQTVARRCAQPCCTPSDCPQSASVCKPIDWWSGSRDANVGQPYGFQKVCLWREYQGTKELGEVCTSNAQCKSEICAPGPSGVARCTRTCCTSSDCSGFSWGPVCRPPFLSGSGLSTTDFSSVLDALGRWYIGFIIYESWANSTLCMPE